MQFFTGAVLLTVVGCGSRETEPRAPVKTAEAQVAAEVTAPPQVPSEVKSVGTGAKEEPSGLLVPAEVEAQTQTFGSGLVAKFEMRQPPWALLAVDRPVRSDGDPPSFTYWGRRSTIPVGKQELTYAELSPDGEWVVAMSQTEGVIYRFDTHNIREIERTPIPEFDRHNPGALKLWPKEGDDEVRVLHVGPLGHRIIDLRSGAVRTLSTVPGMFVRVGNGFHTIGSVLTGPDGVASRFDLFLRTAERAHVPALSLELRGRLQDFVLTQDTKHLVALDPNSNRVHVFDLAERKIVREFEIGGNARTIALSPDERYLAVGGRDLRVFEFESGRLVGRETGYGGDIHLVRFSPAGESLVTTSYDGRIRIFALDGGRLRSRQTLRHQRVANVYAISFSDDARVMATSSGDRSIKVWERWPKPSP